MLFLWLAFGFLTCFSCHVLEDDDSTNNVAGNNSYYSEKKILYKDKINPFMKDIKQATDALDSLADFHQMILGGYHSRIQNIIEDNLLIPLPDSIQRTFSDIFSLYDNMTNYEKIEELKIKTSILERTSKNISDCFIRGDNKIILFASYWGKFFADYTHDLTNIMLKVMNTSRESCVNISTNASEHGCFVEATDAVNTLKRNFMEGKANLSEEISNIDLCNIETCENGFDLNALQNIRDFVANEIKLYFEHTEQPIVLPKEKFCENNPICHRLKIKSIAKEHKQKVLDELRNLRNIYERAIASIRTDLIIQLGAMMNAIRPFRLLSVYVDNSENSVDSLSDSMKGYENLDELKAKMNRFVEMNRTVSNCLSNVQNLEFKQAMKVDRTPLFKTFNFTSRAFTCQRLVIENSSNISTCFDNVYNDVNKLVESEKKRLGSQLSYVRHQVYQDYIHCKSQKDFGTLTATRYELEKEIRCFLLKTASNCKVNETQKDDSLFESYIDLDQ